MSLETTTTFPTNGAAGAIVIAYDERTYDVVLEHRTEYGTHVVRIDGENAVRLGQAIVVVGERADRAVDDYGAAHTTGVRHLTAAR